MSVPDAFLRPRSVAILGASADVQKRNGRTLKAPLDERDGAQLYPVNLDRVLCSAKGVAAVAATMLPRKP